MHFANAPVVGIRRKSKKRHFTSQKQNLLIGILREVNDRIRALETLAKEFGRADSKNPALVRQATELFDQLLTSIDDAQEALESRLRRRILRLRGLFHGDRYDPLVSRCNLLTMFKERAGRRSHSLAVCDLQHSQLFEQYSKRRG